MPFDENHRNKIRQIFEKAPVFDDQTTREVFVRQVFGSHQRFSAIAKLAHVSGRSDFGYEVWNHVEGSADQGVLSKFYEELKNRILNQNDQQWIEGQLTGPVASLPLSQSDTRWDPSRMPSGGSAKGRYAGGEFHMREQEIKEFDTHQIHIEGGGNHVPEQAALQQPTNSPKDLSAVRFTIRQTSQISARTKYVKASLVREDSAARITRTEVEVKLAVPTFEQKEQIASYFNSEFTGDSAHAVQELMKYVGRKLFQDCFAKTAASNELYLYRQANRKLEFVVEGEPTFHSIPWELMRYVFTNSPTSTPIVDQAPIFRQVVNPPDFHPLRPPGDAPLRILWVSARMPHDSIARDAVLGPVRTALAESNVILDEVLSGSFLEMKLKLNEHREKPKYHILHLDMHGIVMSPADLRLQFGGCQNWVLDARDGGLGNLPRCTDDPGFLFESTFIFFNQGPNSVPVSAHELSAALAFGGVSLVVLNACHSAEVPLEGASMLAHLVQSGGYPAVGFQHSLTATGAILFFKHFYPSLAAPKTSMDIQQAVHAGRQALRNHSMRGSRPIEDGHLPALYTLPGVSRI